MGKRRARHRCQPVLPVWSDRADSAFPPAGPSLRAAGRAAGRPAALRPTQARLQRNPEEASTRTGGKEWRRVGTATSAHSPRTHGLREGRRGPAQKAHAHRAARPPLELPPRRPDPLGHAHQGPGPADPTCSHTGAGAPPQPSAPRARSPAHRLADAPRSLPRLERGPASGTASPGGGLAPRPRQRALLSVPSALVRDGEIADWGAAPRRVSACLAQKEVLLQIRRRAAPAPAQEWRAHPDPRAGASSPEDHGRPPRRAAGVLPRAPPPKRRRSAPETAAAKEGRQPKGPAAITPAPQEGPCPDSRVGRGDRAPGGDRCTSAS